MNENKLYCESCEKEVDEIMDHDYQWCESCCEASFDRAQERAYDYEESQSLKPTNEEIYLTLK